MATDSIGFAPGDGSRAYSFSIPPCLVEWDLISFFGAPIIITSDILPFRDGTVVRSVQLGPRTLEIPIVITATGQALYNELAIINDVTNIHRSPPKAPGLLTWISAAGTTRQVRCHYIGGLEAAETEGNASRGSRKFVVRFLAPSGVWE